MKKFTCLVTIASIVFLTGCVANLYSQYEGLTCDELTVAFNEAEIVLNDLRAEEQGDNTIETVIKILGVAASILTIAAAISNPGAYDPYDYYTPPQTIIVPVDDDAEKLADAEAHIKAIIDQARVQDCKYLVARGNLVTTRTR